MATPNFKTTEQLLECLRDICAKPEKTLDTYLFLKVHGRRAANAKFGAWHVQHAERDVELMYTRQYHPMGCIFIHGAHDPKDAYPTPSLAAAAAQQSETPAV